MKIIRLEHFEKKGVTYWLIISIFFDENIFFLDKIMHNKWINWDLTCFFLKEADKCAFVWNWIIAIEWCQYFGQTPYNTILFTKLKRISMVWWNITSHIVWSKWYFSLCGHLNNTQNKLYIHRFWGKMKWMWHKQLIFSLVFKMNLRFFLFLLLL